MATVSVLLQFIIFAYLFFKEKQGYFKIWTISWGFYLLRQILEIISIYIKSGNFLPVCIQLSALLSGLCLLWGAYRFIGKRMAWVWWITGSAVGLFISSSKQLNSLHSWMVFQSFQLTFQWAFFITFLFYGLVYCWTGVIFLRSSKISGAGKWLTGWGLIVWGIHKLNYPLIRPVEWLAEWGFFITFLLGFIVAIGTILTYFEKVRTERELIEEELRESEERYRKVVEFFPGPIFIQSEGKCVFANPAMAKLYGISDPKELYGKIVLDHIPPHLQHIVGSRIEAINKNIKIPVLEIQLIQVDGTIIDVEVAPTPFIYDKKPAALVLAKDISERKRYEEQLRKLSYAVEQSPTMTVITDKNGYIEYINPRFTQVTGFNPTEVIGKHCSTLGTNGENNQEPPEFVKVIPSGKEWRGEILSLKKTGEVFWEMCVLSPIKNQHGEITHYLKVGEDITQRKHEEQELQKAKAEAEAANHSKSQFLANISHEIRTAMNCINGMTELLYTTEITPAQKEYLELVKSSADSLMNLINDILDLARIEAGKLRLEQLSFDLKALILEIFKIYQLQAEQKGLQFEAWVAPEVPDNLTGDPGRLRQVLANLLGNAIKFTEKGGVTLRIEVQKQSSLAMHILFTVSDTGIGVKPDKIDLLFKNFSQVEGNRINKSNGSGLGLAICKQLVELMNGRIWVESEAGSGSKFSFMVPFLKSKTAAALGTIRYQPKELPEKTLTVLDEKIKVLVVEDHPVNQRFVSLTLQKIGAEVTLAVSGNKALKILESENFDLILMDVQMPEMDGYETTIRIREQERLTGRRTPIVALTAYAMEEDKKQCFAAGMDSYLIKPINTTQLNSLLTHILKQKNYQDGSSQLTPIDVTATLRIVDGDIQLVRELVTGFKNDCPQRLAEMRKTYQKGDFTKLKHLAHRLKGSLSYFGAEKAMLLTGQLEQFDNSEQPAAILTVLQELEMEMERIIEFINQFERENYHESFNC
jgi:PAS domain S-box-containing protein